MDEQRFDRLTRLLSTSARRRPIVAVFASSVLTSVLSHDAAGKKKRKKKKKPTGCSSRSCFNKVCGQDDGCGGKCTVQDGCDADEACVDGSCVANVCNPACLGNTVCQPNGDCTCPTGLKRCQGAGFGDNCHECCPDALSGDGDEDCEGSPNGAYCRDLDNDGDLFLSCGCFSAARTCPNGTCGGCCEVNDCYTDYFGEGPEDSGRECVVVNQETGEYGCRCRSGTTACPGGLFCAEQGNRRACGASCEWCGFRTDYEPNYVCVGNPQRCCLPTAAPCAFANQACCSGVNGCVLNAEGTTFVCT